MQTNLYFASIVCTCALTGWLAYFAWRRPGVAGARVYAGMALCECLLALAEILSMLSPTRQQALVWFNLRFLFTATIPVLFVVFVLAYQGGKDWLSNYVGAGLFVIPVLTQILLWSNSLHGIWVKQEVDFFQSGPFWLVETGARIPGIWFMLHTFYSLIVLLLGIGLLLLAAWGKRRLFKVQALLLAGGALIALVTTLFPVFNWLPKGGFNPFIPGIGASALLYALAIFRFQFLQRAPAQENLPNSTPLQAQEKRSLGLFVLIFVVMAACFTAVGYLTYINFESQLLTQAKSQLASIAALKVAGLREWRSERLADARILFKNAAFSTLVQRYLENPADAQAQTELQTWLKNFNDRHQYDRVFLVDTSGVERLSASAASEPDSALLSQVLTAGISAAQVTFLDFHRNAAAGPIHLALLVPILANQDQHGLGGVVLHIAPETYLYPFIQQWPVPRASAETLLVRRDGADVLYLNTLSFRPDAALNLRVPLVDTENLAVKAVLGQTGIVEALDYRGVPVIGDLHAVPDSPWFLISRIDTAEVYAPLWDRLWLTITFCGLLILAAGVGLVQVWWQQRLRFYQVHFKASEALHKSEENYRQLFEQATDGIFIADARGNYVDVNLSGCALLGYTREEILQFNLRDLVAAEDQIKVPLRVDELKAGKKLISQRKMRPKSGALIDVEISGSTLADGRLLGIVHNISERKQAADALRRRNEYLVALQETTLDLLSHLEINALLENIVRRAGLLMGTASGYLDLLETRSGLLLPQVGMGALVESLQHPVQLGKGVTGMVWQSRQPVVVNDYDHWSGRIPNYTTGLLAAVIGVPLLYRGQILGVLGLGRTFAGQRSFEPEDVEILTQFASLAAIAIEKARLFAVAQQELVEHNRAEKLIRVRLNLLELSAVDTLEQVLRATLDEIGELTASPVGFYHFVAADQKTISLQVWSTRTQREFCKAEGQGLYYSIDQAGVWVECAYTQKPVFHNDYASLPGRKGYPEGHVPLLRELVVPILRSGRVVAILGVGNKPTDYTPEDADLVAYFGDVAWEIAERKHQAAQIMAAQTELQRLLANADQSRRSLLSMVEDQKLADEEIRRLNAELEQRVLLRTAQLQASNKELESFAYSVSHDLRAPLRAIDGFSRILQQEYAQNLDEEGNRLLKVVRDNTGKMDHLITDLLALSRVSRSELSYSSVDMTGLVRSVYAELATPEVLEKFVLRVANLPRAAGDPTLLRQVWMNLISNAIKYTLPQAERSIEISGWEQAGVCTYAIKDSGVGFNPKFYDRLFGLFQRLHKAGEFEGTGVGLAIVQRIVHRHGGRVSAESQPGAGATFTFTIPERQEKDE